MKIVTKALAGMITKIGNMFTVKTFITFAVTAVFVIKALCGNLTNEITTITTMVLSFYFGVQHEQSRHKDPDDETSSAK